MAANHCGGAPPESASGKSHSTGHAEHVHIQLPFNQWLAAVKQYQLPRRHEEITATTGELQKLGIIRAAHSSFNSPMWSMWKLDGTWRMMVDYQELNKVVLPIHAVVPSVMDLME